MEVECTIKTKFGAYLVEMVNLNYQILNLIRTQFVHVPQFLKSVGKEVPRY